MVNDLVVCGFYEVMEILLADEDRVSGDLVEEALVGEDLRDHDKIN